ncbi:DEAD-box ATP-dependent RNA helicase 58, chloroplastic isoform X2 [Eucalyptus grandis]|uniref:DEAD-box ATP-dependent RNA helicase 58, chloroplastic isoform X2 n=1 Tax=Eucalyptus grandis TaxID=71139 RepID=UPI00192E840A|nr:DEAD-box ATP-dependent RNA helicase 58, chloroplastic isoform X2 [Eucalyptus grandis]
MASSSATKLVSPSSLFLLRNPEPKFSVLVTARPSQSPLSTSSRKPPPALLSFSSAADEADPESAPPTLRRICGGHVPEHVLRRMEEVGYVLATDVQREGLPALFSGRDCVLHAQTGSGKTLTYLLRIFSVVNTQRSSVQALIVVPTRELGIQVAKVARLLAAKPMDLDMEQDKSCTVMALLDGGTLKRHKSWLKAEPPAIVVATIGSLCQMLEKQVFKLDTVQILVIDEVDFMFNSSKQVSSLRKLLTSYSSCNNRQTVFTSASIPQHNRFLHDCIQQKWTKGDVVHVHLNPIQPMPSCLNHRFVTCHRSRRHQTLLHILQWDSPKSGIIFVGEQSEKSKKAGNAPSTTLLLEFFKNSYGNCSNILLLEGDMNFNARAASLSEVRQKEGYLIIATDIAARGIDLPETTHIYNFDLPRTAVDYLHRAGRTGRKPFSDKKCVVTSIIASEERFVLKRYENELFFACEELVLSL